MFQEVQNGRADFGVVPIENSTEGQVKEVLDLLIDTPLVIISEILQPVRHALMSLDGDPSKIRRIVSHQQSLGQCRGYLSSNFANRELEAVASNALAAQRAAQDASLGAIASRAAAEAYGLQVIAENIQDLAQNTTRFLVMGTRGVPEERTRQDHHSVRGAGQGRRAQHRAEHVREKQDQHFQNRVASFAWAFMGISLFRRSGGA